MEKYAVEKYALFHRRALTQEKNEGNSRPNGDSGITKISFQQPRTASADGDKLFLVCHCGEHAKRDQNKVGNFYRVDDIPDVIVKR